MTWPGTVRLGRPGQRVSFKGKDIGPGRGRLGPGRQGRAQARPQPAEARCLHYCFFRRQAALAGPGGPAPDLTGRGGSSCLAGDSVSQVPGPVGWTRRVALEFDAPCEHRDGVRCRNGRHSYRRDPTPGPRAPHARACAQTHRGVREQLRLEASRLARPGHTVTVRWHTP